MWDSRVVVEMAEKEEEMCAQSNIEFDWAEIKSEQWLVCNEHD